MPEISRFYGIIIYLISKDHNPPHIHADYSGEEGVFEIVSGEMVQGKLPVKVIKMVKKWIDIHQDELMADWENAKNGGKIFKITPLKK